MGNMSYVRFENTYADLKDCADAMSDDGFDPDDLSVSEKEYYNRLIALCRFIINENEVAQ